MSTISTAFDAVVTTVGTLLSSHIQIPNPYVLSDNHDMVLRKGFGVGIGIGENTHRTMGDQHSIDRVILIVVTRQIFASETDTTAKNTGVKNLLEDHELIIAEAGKADKFGLSSSVSDIDYVSDNGIEAVRGDKENFLSISSTFSLKYINNI